jgi:arsenite methyltransferase
MNVTEELKTSKAKNEKSCCGSECCGDENTDIDVAIEERTEAELKEIVKEQYSKVALASKDSNEASCCGTTSSCCSTDTSVGYTVMADEYKDLKGYNPDADLGLGCGLPTQFAKIKEGDTVVDLGSGAGNDCFVARAEAGEKGRVIGIDMTPAMVDKAKANAAKLGFKNVEFHLAEIENMPIENNTADVVVSNCVLNLVPNKSAAFAEIYRIMKPGGHFSISDIVISGELPAKIKTAASMYAGCVSGAVKKEEYLEVIKETGFVNISIQKEKLISVPDDIYLNYLTKEEVMEFKKSGFGIYSITVYAEKA